MKNYLIIILVSITSLSNAQKFGFSLGRAISDYHLINNSGQTVDYLKPGTGMVLKAGLQKSFLDTLSLQMSSSEKALKYSQKPVLSKILSLLTYSAGMQLQQINAIGEVQQILLNYQTDYIGLELGLGVKIPVKKLFTLQAKGTLSANKLLYGSQQSGNNFFLLKGNPQFDDLKLMKGFQIEVATRINSTTDFVFGYSASSTVSPTLASTGKLDLSTQSYLLGFNFYFNK